MFVFYVSFVWKVYKPVTVQYYMADHVIWLPRLTLLDFWTLSQNRTHSFVGDLVYFRRRHWPPTPVLLPGKSHGQRSLVGCSPWDRQESDTTERLPFHFSLPCIEEGSGNPLQCSCLENPRDGGAWWAAVCAVAQSQTRLQRLSSSSSSSFLSMSLIGSASLVAQWLRIHLAMQETLVWSLIRADLTCHRAPKPMSHNNWAHTREP